MKIPSFQAAAVFAAIGLASCGESQTTGGSGSEAGNAVTVLALSPTGQPVADALVEIRPASSTSEVPLFALRTSGDGIARSTLPDGGWAVVVRKEGLAYRNSIILSDTALRQDTVSDTLRPTTRLAGILSGCRERTLAAIGGGGRTVCDRNGFFQIESLPSGELPLAIVEASLPRFFVRLEPGVNSLTLEESESLPSNLAILPSDSLIPWSTSRLPASLPKPALPDSGSFSIAVRFRRIHIDTALWAIEWHDGTSSGIRIGWRGRDTMLAKLNGRTYRTVGIPLDTGIQQIGLSWDGHRIAILRGEDSVFTLTSNSFDRRAAWNGPIMASSGISRLDWIAFKRGKLVEDWLRRLSRM